jgi:hypothetical protein
VPCFVQSLALAVFNCSVFGVFGGVGLSTLSAACFSLSFWHNVRIHSSYSVMCPHYKRHVSETSHVAAVGTAIGSAIGAAIGAAIGIANDYKASSQNIYIRTCSFS